MNDDQDVGVAEFVCDVQASAHQEGVGRLSASTMHAPLLFCLMALLRKSLPLPMPLPSPCNLTMLGQPSRTAVVLARKPRSSVPFKLLFRAESAAASAVAECPTSVLVTINDMDATTLAVYAEECRDGHKIFTVADLFHGTHSAEVRHAGKWA